jgi:hypothetical protein
MYLPIHENVLYVSALIVCYVLYVSARAEREFTAYSFDHHDHIDHTAHSRNTRTIGQPCACWSSTHPSSCVSIFSVRLVVSPSVYLLASLPTCFSVRVSASLPVYWPPIFTCAALLTRLLIRLSPCMYACLSVCLYTRLCVSIYTTIYVSVSLSACVFVCLYLSLFLPFRRLTVRMSFRVSFSPSLFVCLSACKLPKLLIFWSVYISACATSLFTHLSVQSNILAYVFAW